MSYNLEDENLDKAKQIIDSGIDRAQEVLKDSSKVEELLFSLADRLEDIPTAGPLLANAPKMIALVKSYITKEYTNVSPKVIVSLVAAFIYLVKNVDLIPDFIPILGRVDDIAILGAALKLCEPELKAFEDWRETKQETL
ncbi:MAG: DUF1232 domain-containing protein [Lachnospiraceae bacterium]|nr:DUF1232 domain-containing protein [Lachnospiraceae bacterium]